MPSRQAFSVTVAVLVSVTVACSQRPAGPPTERLSIATGGTGGVFYPYGGGIAKLISEHLGHVEATAEVTAASVDNLKFLHRGTSDLAFTMSDTARDGLLGQGAFTDFGAVQVRALAVLYSSYAHLVTRSDSAIRSVADLRGRVISTGAAGSGTAVLATRILEAAGVDPNADVQAQSLGVAQSVDALKDGKIEAFFWNGGLPTAAVLDLVHTPGMNAHLVPTDGVLPNLEQTYGASLYYREVIPGDVYGMETDTAVVAVANMLVAAEAMSESLAYDITRLLFERQGDLAAIHPQALTLALETAGRSSAIPYHPGAIRYYKERQVWTAR
jgi:TRAP transporter TAXI family solute receptor